MAAAGNETGQSLFQLEGEALGLADRLPDLLLEALRISSTVAHGLHGRRRAGPGETFWQFRQYETSDLAQSIDWRRSANSDHLYIREREWEAAHTVWLWPDLSPSMSFRSRLAPVWKRDRALVLTLAAADLLVRGGERVALLGLTQPTASRRATTRLAESIASNLDAPQLKESLPPEGRVGRFSGVLLFGDFLDPVEDIMARVRRIAGADVNGHVVQIMDPAEETLPYEGRTEFVGMEGNTRWVIERVESARELYRQRLEEHRQRLSTELARLGWSFYLHHTDRPATEPLLQLILRMQSPQGVTHRWGGQEGEARPRPSDGGAS